MSSLLVFGLTAAALAQVGPGDAEGFEIDGNLLAGSPSGFDGIDWLDGPGNSNGVLDALGIPKDSTTTFHLIDLTKNDDIDVFFQGSKVDQNPLDHAFKAMSAPQKDDIQNGLIHFFRDGDGDQWFAVAGDRRATNGDSYLDFEFLQNTLAKDPLNPGKFVTEGPDGGRTIGDILVTIHFIKGGSQAEFFAQEWMDVGGGDFDYVDITPNPGDAFVAANIDSEVVVTYGAFGQPLYAINAFGEAAVNLNELIPNLDECFSIATVFIRTKASQSPSAELKDLIAPLQLNLCLDEEPPEITCPPDMVVECDAPTDPGTLGGAPTASDNCSDDPLVDFSDVVQPGDCPNEFTILRTWTAVDECGNMASCLQTISVVDTTAPVIDSGPGPVTVECIGDVPAPDVGLISATDNCDSSVTVTHEGDESAGTCPTVITRTYRATDDCGNYSDFVQLITVSDTTAPEITCPADVVVQCIGDVPDPDISLVTATDNCDTNVTIEFVGDVSDGQSCPETITRTYKATDDCENFSLCTQLITVNDTIPPEITCPADVAVQCIGDVPAPDIGLVTASDNCDSDPTIEHVGDASDGETCPETITRTYKATDDCGNMTTCMQIITVNDTIPPEITCPADVAVQCIDDVPAADISLVTATDNCDTSVTIEHVGDASDGQSCPETITRTYRATDDCGNMMTCLQVITVDDTIPPEITCPADVVVQCIDDVPPFDISLVTASDNCDDDVDIEHVSDRNDGNTCPTTITRTYKATDDCGNFATCLQIITVNDTIPPEITCPADVAVQCEGDVPAPDVSAVSASDNCDDDVEIEHVGDSRDGSCPLTITRTYKATDDCGNMATCDQIITVNDTIPPVITCPADVAVQCSDDVPAPDASSISATDNCDNDVDVVHVGDSSDGQTCPETITRTYKATDDCGNMMTCMQIITVNDTIPPEITCPADITVQCDFDVPDADPSLVSASDNCDDDVDVVHMGDVSDGNTCPLTITRTYKATDDCGNWNTCVQYITVNDTIPPMITFCPSDTTIDCGATPEFGTPEATDNCDIDVEIIVVSTQTIPGSTPGSVIATRVWEARDDCGNVSTRCSQTITSECPEEFCSFTQGFYGNAGGTFNGQGTLSIIQDLLSGSSLVVGLPGRQITIPYESAHCIIQRLPGGGTPTALPEGLGNSTLEPVNCQTTGGVTIPLDDEDRFDNILLSQTITLSLNVRYDDELGGLQLQTQFCTQGVDPVNGIYGDGDDVPFGPVQAFFIPSAVIDALDNLGLSDDVYGLLALANRALGGALDLGGATYGQINLAVDAINRGFDECRFIVPCGSVLATSSNPIADGSAPAPALAQDSGNESLPMNFEMGQNVPNPFNPHTRITLALPKASDWTLTVYNVQGQLVKRFSGHSGAGYVYVDWDGTNRNGSRVAPGVYFYRVETGDFTDTKKMVLIK